VRRAAPQENLRLPAGFATLAEPAAAAAGAAGATVLARASFIHVQCATVHRGAVQAVDGAIGLVGIAHFDEGEAARAASVTIRHDGDAIDRSVFLKPGADRCFSRPEIQIANKDVLQVFFFLI